MQVAAAEELASNALALSHYQTNNDADEVRPHAPPFSCLPKACLTLKVAVSLSLRLAAVQAHIPAFLRMMVIALSGSCPAPQHMHAPQRPPTPPACTHQIARPPALTHAPCCMRATVTACPQVNITLIESLLSYICEEGQFRRAPAPNGGGGGGAGAGAIMGAVLVFLPGWDEIMRLKDRLEASPCFGSSRCFGGLGGLGVYESFHGM